MANPASRDYKTYYRLLTSPARVLPDFIIPGEAKCGTTSLYSYLAKHPDIYPADVKEPNNFIRYPQSVLFCKRHYPTYFQKIYQRFFRKRFITGEASAEYLSKKDVPEFIASILPDIKIIVLLRNPVFRAYSDFQMLKSHGVIADKTFDELAQENVEWLNDEKIKPLVELAPDVEHNPLRCVQRGIYADNIENWLKWFSRKSFLFIKSETFFERPQEVLDRVFEFLCVEPFNAHDFPVKKPGLYDKKLSVNTIKLLSGFFEPHNKRLYKLIDFDFNWENENEKISYE